MFLAPLVYLGWGRCGILGEGSSVVEFGEELVPWEDPRDLDVRGDRGMFCFLGWRALILGLGNCAGCHGRPRRLYWTCRELDTGSCLVPAGRVGDLDLGGIYWISVHFRGDCRSCSEDDPRGFTEGIVSGTGACKLLSLQGCLEYLDLCAIDLWTLILGVGSWGACLNGS